MQNEKNMQGNNIKENLDLEKSLRGDDFNEYVDFNETVDNIVGKNAGKNDSESGSENTSGVAKENNQANSTAIYGSQKAKSGIALSLNDVNYKYPGTTKNVLKGLKAQFEYNKVYTIIGKSGSGKTTLLSLLAGLDLATNGKILYHGTQDMAKLDRNEYRSKKVGIVFQSYNLITTFTAVENIVLSMNISKIKHSTSLKEQAYKLLEYVGIDTDTANRKVLKLSGGEQQRVGIARAIAHNPDILIADEPTGNLDKETEQIIMDIFVEYAKKGNCVILVAHTEKMTHIADSVIKMKQGFFVK